MNSKLIYCTVFHFTIQTFFAECDSALFNQTEKNFASLELLSQVTQTTIDMLLDVSSNANVNDYIFWDKNTNTSIVGPNPYIREETQKPFYYFYYLLPVLPYFYVYY